MIALTGPSCCPAATERCTTCGGTRYRYTLGVLLTSGAHWAEQYAERCLRRGAWPERWPWDVADAARRLATGPSRPFDGTPPEVRVWMAERHHGAAAEAWGQVIERVRQREDVERVTWGRVAGWRVRR